MESTDSNAENNPKYLCDYKQVKRKEKYNSIFKFCV